MRISIIFLCFIYNAFVAIAQQQTDLKAVCGNELHLRDTSLAPEAGSFSDVFPVIPRSTFVIPVVFHVIWKNPAWNVSDEMIFSQIEALNRDFNGNNETNSSIPMEFRAIATTNIGIHFCLATSMPSGKSTTGIVRKQTDISNIGLSDALYYDSLGGSTAWDTRYYLNIWVAETGKFISGFGTRPGLVGPEKDGVVIHPKYFGINNHTNYGLGRVGVHEVGHYFGLRHLWGSTGNCNTDDGLTDTPQQRSAHSGCPEYPQYSCETSNMFMNFMDYTDDPCMSMFTQQQKNIIIHTLTEERATLLNHQNIVCNAQKTDNNFSIYPNPTADYLTIAFSSDSEVRLVDFQITSIDGRIVLSDKVAMSPTHSIDLSFLPNGLYLIRIGMTINRFLVIQ